jgi:2-succinyl-5-enolpyruvyl-6-hydroxy-3-cyclohexene-1-carboxylate synthase
VNPSTALATVLVDELARGGVREAVLAPGSRSAPLALALHDADAAGLLRLHVRVDERSAGFLALGLAKASAVPVPVVTTSGTATANLHPAVLEASHAGVPLVALTADRPPELRGNGANQTVDQAKLYGGAARLFRDLGAPEQRAGQNAYWRSTVCRALAAAQGSLTRDPGPVHLNLPLREPLVPDGSAEWVESLDGRPDGAAWTQVAPAGAAVGPAPEAPARSVVLAGDCPPVLGRLARATAEAGGWPLLAEPSSNARGGPNAVPAYGLLLDGVDFFDGHRPERVVCIGRPTLSRAVQRLLADPRVRVDRIPATARWADPGSAAGWVVGIPPTPADPPERAWLAGWVRAGLRAAAAVDALLDAGELGEERLARDVVAAVPDGALLVLGSSKPVRDVDLHAAPRDGVTILANRGVAGIDGTVSTAVGAALAYQRAGGGPAYALLGDLTFLHDANGLLLGPAEPRPDLCLVVVNNDGGGLFGLLEQGAPEHSAAFERVFGTPHGVDLGAICAATGVAYEQVADPAGLRAALVPGPGVRVVEVRTDRSAARGVQARLRAAVAAALSSPGG